MYQNYGNTSKGYSQSSNHCGKENCCPKARPITKKYRFCQWYDCCVTCKPVKAPIYKETGCEKHDKFDKFDKKGQDMDYGFEKETEYDDYEWESGYYDDNDLY